MIDPQKYGVSFSIKQCRAFGLGQRETLDWLLARGLRRFRLMSYWDEHERTRGTYDFAALDEQIARIEKAGGVVSLCLGARQPRWPENHWPEWAWQASKAERSKALLQYIQTVVERYRSHTCIVSYQLENEALLENFGRRPEVDRRRLRQEYTLAHRLDPARPVIMTTSTSWGIPMRRPVPDVVGFSYYHIAWNGRTKQYTRAGHSAAVHRLRARLIRTLLRRPSFIHELQCEPWGPKAIWEMDHLEQDKSMSIEQIVNSFAKAHQTRLTPIDLWGAEWWYWRHKNGDASIWNAVHDQLSR
ncbi:MAG TPA: beta-galactosidase [Candidatus Saccharimonadales bacterium]|nr:beta-galactosidase [Candidatus Saccharimonadales bacterium]